MTTETLSSVYQETVRAYGQVASHTLDAYYGVAQRALQGVDARIQAVLNSERITFAEDLRNRLSSAQRSVAGAIEGGVTKARSDAQGLIDRAVNATNGGIGAVAGFAGKFDEKYPQVSAATAPAIQAGLPAARMTRDVVQYVANGVEKLADRLNVEVAPVAKAAKEAAQGVRKTVRKAATQAKAGARRARKAD